MERWLAYVREYHVDDWAREHQQVLEHAQQGWQELGQGRAQLNDLPEHLQQLENFIQDVAMDRESREGQSVAIPENAHLNYYAWEAGREQDLRDYEASLRDRESLEAAQARYREDWELSDAGITAEERTIARYVEQESFQYRPPNSLEIDTSDDDLGEKWQAQLAALDARMEALAQESERHEQTQRQGVRY
jgi:hypothetical protein